MDSLQNGADKLLAQAHTACDGEHTAADILPAVALQDSHIVGLLDGANLIAGVHTTIEQIENLGVNLVNLLTAYIQLVVWA